MSGSRPSSRTWTRPSSGTPVEACPGWPVRDVMAHLTAVAEDVTSGRLTRPPTDEEAAAAQVARLDGLELSEVLGRWAVAALDLEPVLTVFDIWPAGPTWPPTSRTSAGRSG